MSLVIRSTVFLAVAVSAIAASTAVAAAPVVQNGGFETGDLTNWTVKQSGAFHWDAYTGNTLPGSGDGFFSPPRGDWAAVAQQEFISQGFLYQDLKLPRNATALKFITYYENGGSEFATPHDLKATADQDPNQQYRVDLIRPKAKISSLDSGDLLKNLFRTKVGDPQELDPTVITADVSKLAGRSVRLRFAVADNQGALDAAVDGVKVKTSK
jgi:opacity protein-like surface antigen